MVRCPQAPEFSPGPGDLSTDYPTSCPEPKSQSPVNTTPAFNNSTALYYD